MKKKSVLILLFTFLITATLSQAQQRYAFSQMVKKVKVETASGSVYRILNKSSGPFTLEFSKSTDSSIEKIITVISPGENINGLLSPWYGHLEDKGYFEYEGKLFQRSIYGDSSNATEVTFLLAQDFSRIIIFRKDGSVSDYIK